MSQPMNTSSTREQLVDARTCIEELFKGANKPSFRTFQAWKARGWVPCVKIGHRVYFDVAQVRAAFDKRFTIKAGIY
jgi:hypothetical protein